MGERAALQRFSTEPDEVPTDRDDGHRELHPSTDPTTLVTYRRPPTWRTDLLALVAELDDAVDAAIVEGPNDRRGLRTAGFTKRVYTCSEAGGLAALASRIDEDRVVILTDFDPAGRRLNARLRELLDDSQVDPEWRRKVGAALTPHGRRDIESLNNLFRHRW
ncbi:5S rRNA maturation endonuclease (Ribonuclease M5), contains TOPRIM domain [Halogranum gelatinilyticum]|uniref:5S rRNA maturation endonuclease (Ribonuclease M5), contains TOPRIM domain n=1 Tax=Halogranum gelatinilyticum TaxID=660521 RepID=A0A1G9UUZ2_9EURY|nr:hypothetical protein [Halogranum gelatinilyticum]SDM63425.1 5S rRNA maturation endonuclease (Ribonuclease M5), contains TOPRIM domain [Halogranum gelatinilyticum]